MILRVYHGICLVVNVDEIGIDVAFRRQIINWWCEYNDLGIR